MGYGYGAHVGQLPIWSQYYSIWVVWAYEQAHMGSLGAKFDGLHMGSPIWAHRLTGQGDIL